MWARVLQSATEKLTKGAEGLYKLTDEVSTDIDEMNINVNAIVEAMEESSVNMSTVAQATGKMTGTIL